MDLTIRPLTPDRWPALEAYPVDDAVAGATTNRFTGALAAFLGAGFVELARRSPARPVLRHDLEGVAA